MNSGYCANDVAKWTRELPVDDGSDARIGADDVLRMKISR